MSTLSKKAHRTLAIFGICFGLFVAFTAYESGVEQYPEVTISRYMLAGILVVYSASQFFILFKHRSSLIKIALFPSVYILFALFWDYSCRGYVKNWAPATPEEAGTQNMVNLAILIAIFVFALASTFLSSNREKNV